MTHWTIVPLVAVLGAALSGGCAATAGGAAGGAAGYEYSNQRALEELDADYRAGRINKNEYDQRRQDIEQRSVVY
jgi:hypothetical protein